MDNTLKHWGVLGMHWGVRRGSSTSTAHPDSTTAAALKKKKLHELSNAELKTLTTRLQLEKQFKDLSKQEMSAGKKFVTDLLVGQLKTEAASALITLSKTIAPHVLKAIKDRVDKANK